MADDRIIHPIEKSVISAVKGNLIYQKFKFIISANYSIALTDRNIDKSLVLYWKMSGIELAPGSKVYTARCKNLYILTTKHKITARNKIDKIKIENPFEKIITVIDNNDYSYKEIDIEEDLEIVKERLSTSSVPNTLTRASSSWMSTSKRNYEIPQNLLDKEEITPYHYFITRIINQRRYKILINTGQEENYITRELVLEEEITKTGHICPGLPSEIVNINEETTEKEIIIGGIPLIIQFKIYQGNHNITLGIK